MYQTLLISVRLMQISYEIQVQMELTRFLTSEWRRYGVFVRH